MNYFISLLLLFLVVDGPLQTNAVLMYLNINGSELKTAGRLTPHAVPAASAGLGATKRPKRGTERFFTSLSPSLAQYYTSEFRRGGDFRVASEFKSRCFCGHNFLFEQNVGVLSSAGVPQSAAVGSS